MNEFIEDNLSTGSICQPDDVKFLDNGRSCPQAQTFMQVSMMYEFFVRVYLSYGDVNGGLLKAVQGIPEGLFLFATSKNNGNINYNGNHAYLLDCTTNASRTALVSCTYEDAGDGLYLYDHNVNSLMSVILLGHYFKPSLDYCKKVEDAWHSESLITSNWQSVHVNAAGWTKGTSQMMSMMAYGVGMLDLCNRPHSPTSPTPSTMPSRVPSENGFCHPEDVVGNIFFASGGGYCFKIAIGTGGHIIGDRNDPQCHYQSGTGIHFSNYDGFNGNTLNWTSQNGFSGTMDFLENISLSKPKLVINSFQETSGIFYVTLELPSCQTTDSPSLMPSLLPTLEPSSSFCSAEDVSGFTFFTSFAGYCFKIELINNVGQLIGDQTDPTCVTMSGTGIPFSNFYGFSGNTAVWSTETAGFSGTMDFLRDPSVTVPTLINNGLNEQVFDVTLVLPSCNQTP